MDERTANSGTSAKRWDEHGEMRLMAEKDGYVMARRPGYAPFVVSVKEWNALSAEPIPKPPARPITGPLYCVGGGDVNEMEFVCYRTPEARDKAIS